MALRGIRNLIIDLGGVIVDLTRSRCIDAFQQLGIRDVRQHVPLLHPAVREEGQHLVLEVQTDVLPVIGDLRQGMEKTVIDEQGLPRRQAVIIAVHLHGNGAPVHQGKLQGLVPVLALVHRSRGGHPLLAAVVQLKGEFPVPVHILDMHLVHSLHAVRLLLGF